MDSSNLFSHIDQPEVSHELSNKPVQSPVFSDREPRSS